MLNRFTGPGGLGLWLIAVLGGAIALSAGAGAESTEGTTPSVVFLVRHAEKAADDERDPSLSEVGQERARALAHALGDAGVTHLFASEYRRTQLTLAPLAKATGVEVVVVSAREPEAQVAALRELPPGSVAVVAGHSNTVPDLAKRLGASLTGLETHERYGEILPDGDYDRLVEIVVASSGDPLRAMELRYGNQD